MLKKIKYLILSIAFLPILVKAQETHTIQGIVFDNETGLPMYDIYVECDNPIKSLRTEASGKFRFDSLDKNKHQLRFIDSKGYYINIDSTLYPTDTFQQINLMMKITCLFYKQMAIKAIENKNIYFLTEIESSIVSKNDIYFEKKYKVSYYLSGGGCTTTPQNCIREFNKIIGTYLTKTYGNRWKKKVRKDTLF